MFKKITSKVVNFIGKIHWKQNQTISVADHEEIRKRLTNHYYLIVTRRRNYLSTYFIGFAHFLLTGRWGFYSHILMNTEDKVTTDADFRLVEAIKKGVTYSSFSDVFGTVDAVGLIKPKNLTLDEWTNVLDAARTQIGKPYDTLFDLKSDKALSCVELIHYALKKSPNYNEDFVHFENMVNKQGNITPQTFVECQDFEVIWSIRR